MNRRITLVLSFFILTLTCFSQIQDSSWTKKISLQTNGFIKPKMRIPLFETDTFTVYSTFDFVVANIKRFGDEYAVEEDKLLLDKFFNTSKSLDRNLEDIQNDRVLKSRLQFRTADLIQNRECLVYNKMSKKFETMILVTNYIKNWWTGIRFSTQSNQQIMDIRTGAF
jgi:hypothetical protein